MALPAAFDPEDAAFVRDPFAVYRALRNAPKAAFSPREGAWLATRREDVRRVLHDAATYSADDGSPEPKEASRSLGRLSVLGADAPDHGRLRRAFAPAFRRERLAALRPLVARIVDELLDAGIRGGRIELMRGLATPLPLRITAHLLGMAEAEWPKLARWADDEMTAVLPGTPADEARRLLAGSEAMLAYFRDAVERARRGEGEGAEAFDELLAAEDAGRIGRAELLAWLALLVRAGSHTVTNLIGNTVLHLVRDRAALEALRGDPSLWDTAMPELARLAGPLHSVTRVVRRETELHGAALHAGDTVHAVLASANRDERHYDEPDAFRPGRAPGDHVAFGSGQHACLGAELGAMEARIAIERLLERMPLLARADVLEEPQWKSVWAIRGLTRLPLRGALVRTLAT